MTKNPLLAGERNPNVKLTVAQVAEIKRRLASGARQVDLAEQFGMTQPGISSIARGLTWKDVVAAGEPRVVSSGNPDWTENKLSIARPSYKGARDLEDINAEWREKRRKAARKAAAEAMAAISQDDA